MGFLGGVFREAAAPVLVGFLGRHPFLEVALFGVLSPGVPSARPAADFRPLSPQGWGYNKNNLYMSHLACEVA